MPTSWPSQPTDTATSVPHPRSRIAGVQTEIKKSRDMGTATYGMFFVTLADLLITVGGSGGSVQAGHVQNPKTPSGRPWETVIVA